MIDSLLHLGAHLPALGSLFNLITAHFGDRAMTRTVWKFPLEHGPNSLELPAGYAILSAGKDPTGQISVWVDVNDAIPPAHKVPIQFFHTGQSVPDGWNFIGSILDAPFVWHVFCGVPESC